MKTTILYGSQTGTAQDIAERMTREAIQLELKPDLYSMDEFDIGNIQNDNFIIFIASTTGQGDEPDNMKNFWKYLCRKNCKPIFTGIKYCVLGLGDSSYAKFNFVAKRLYKRVNQLGGTSLVEMGLADDQHDLGIDAVVPGWIQSVWTSLLGNNVQHVSGIVGPKFKWSSSLNCKVNQDFSPSSSIVNGTGRRHSGTDADSNKVLSNSCVKFNKVLMNRRVTSLDHFQDVRTITIESKNLSFNPGDVLVVQPCNLQENVDLFFELFPMLNPSQEILLEPQYSWIKISPHFQEVITPCTWLRIVQYYLDIQSVPRKSFFEYLAHFADDEMEQWKLNEFCSPAGQDDLYQYCFKPKRNILEVLMDFPRTTEKLPIEYIFDLIPAIKCRSFSIANYDPHNTVGILVAVVEYKTRLKKPRLGLCSNWLAGLNVGDIVPCWITKGTFKFPDPTVDVPLILIGPGTGCAPFNSLISDRIPTNSANKLFLFFGCRFSQKDYFFETEWTSFQKEGKLNLFVAFSRDSESRLKYVQHQLEENEDLVSDLIMNRNAVIYIAGNAKRMPIDVQESISSILTKHGVQDSDSFIKKLIRQGRYQTEVWS